MGKVSKALNKAVSLPDDVVALPEIASQDGLSSDDYQKVTSKENESESSQFDLTHPSIDNWDERLTYWADKNTGIAENIARLRTKILYSETDEQISSIMITSSLPEEGKSFICANLGISIAQSMERHALLMDCDLRRPTLQKLFGMKHEQGLFDYLQHDEDIHSLIKHTGLSKLSIIPSGKSPQNPSELISSDKMLDLLNEVKSRYTDRLVLLDSPPFLSAAETLVLSQHVDRVIIVVRWGKSSREGIKKMVDSIGQDKIIGIVFNAFEMNVIDRKVQGLSYHNYYSESYY